MWTDTSFVLIAGVCLICAVVAIFAARAALAVRASLVRSIRSCELRSESNALQLEELTVLVNSLAQSLKMQRVRKATTHASRSSNSGDEPDPKTDPEAWRAWKNAQLRAGKFN